MLAAWTHKPDLALTDKETQDYAAAFAELQRHYPALAIMTPKQMAIVGFVAVAFNINAKRVVMLLDNTPVQPPATEGPVTAAPAPPNAYLPPDVHG